MDERSQLIDFKKTSETPGWGHFLVLLNFQREEVLKSGKKAIETGDANRAAYWMAILDGFDKFVGIADNLLKKYQEAVEAARDEQKENLQ